MRTDNIWWKKQRDDEFFFGCPPVAMAKTWKLLHEHDTITNEAKDIHLLWGLHFAKEYPNVKAMCKTVQMPETKKQRMGLYQSGCGLCLKLLQTSSLGSLIGNNRKKMRE